MPGKPPAQFGLSSTSKGIALEGGWPDEKTRNLPHSLTPAPVCLTGEHRGHAPGP